METRQQKLEANAKHMEEVQKQFPGTDTKAMSEGLQRNIHFEYDVKERLGQETWDKMSSLGGGAFDAKSNEEIDAVKLGARRCLDGHDDLQERFDVIYGGINADIVALATRIQKKETP